jgi:hypothetical protein
MICAKPIYVFRELIHYLADQRMVAPGYSIMEDTVGGALVDEQRRLASIVGVFAELDAHNSQGVWEERSWQI